MSEAISPLSTHLLSLLTIPAYNAATRHTFLTQAGTGTLPLARLALWLAQDRIYAAHAYPRFIGSLIALIPYSAVDGVASARERRNAEILRVLVGCLDNIVREVGFFGEVAEKWGMDLDVWEQRKATRDYTAEMARITAQGTLEEGLVFLWAMEKIYLEAWSYVKELQSVSTDNQGKDPALLAATTGAHPKFVAFVNTLQSLVDGLDIPHSSKAFVCAEDTWARAVELEVEFWPQDGEELEGTKKRRPLLSQ